MERYLFAVCEEVEGDLLPVGEEKDLLALAF